MSDKRPVVLVHGMGSNFEHNWHRHGWVEMLEEAGLPVLGFELPGHGSAAPLAATGDSGVERLIEFCEAHGEVDIVGFSLGSVLTLTTAVRRPDLFHRVALLGLADTQLKVTGDDVRASLSDPDNQVIRAVKVAAERAGNNVTTVLDWAMRADAPPSFDELSRLTAPVLLVLGEQDFLGEPDLLLESLPQARLVRLPDTDHFSTPSRFEAKLVVVDFLAS
jgi:pimeloyl-ACP methyl ester carboxylesterase